MPAIQSKAKPSFQKTLKNDYLTLLLAMIGPILLAIGVFADMFGFLPGRNGRPGFDVDPESIGRMLLIGGIATVVLWALMVVRYRSLAKILVSGPRVMARIVDVEFYKDRGRVDFEYTAYGKQIKAGIGLHRSKDTQSLQKGQEVEVAIDPDHRDRAYIVFLYCDPA